MLSVDAIPREVCAFRVFGSRARADADAASDHDVLVIAGEEHLKDEAVAEFLTRVSESFDDVSVYGCGRYAEMHASGHLFTWHIYEESVKALRSEAPDWIDTLGRPAAYEKAVSDAEELIRTFDEAASAIEEASSPVYEAGVLYVVVRNIGVIATAEFGSAEYGPVAPYRGGSLLETPFPLSRAQHDLLRLARKATSTGQPPPTITTAEVHDIAIQVMPWLRELLSILKRRTRGARV